jgi:hypothetical protein
VANAGGLGAGSYRWGPDVFSDDGALDVYIVAARSVVGYLKLAGKVLLHRHPVAPEVAHLRVRRSVSIRACGRRAHRVAVCGDGEAIGHAGVEVALARALLEIVVPEVEKAPCRPSGEGDVDVGVGVGVGAVGRDGLRAVCTFARTFFNPRPATPMSHLMVLQRRRACAAGLARFLLLLDSLPIREINRRRP